MEFLLPLCSSFQCICLIARSQWQWEVQIARTYSLSLSVSLCLSVSVSVSLSLSLSLSPSLSLSLFILFYFKYVSLRPLDCALRFFPLCFSFSSLSLSCFVVVCVFSPPLCCCFLVTAMPQWIKDQGECCCLVYSVTLRQIIIMCKLQVFTSFVVCDLLLESLEFRLCCALVLSIVLMLYSFTEQTLIVWGCMLSMRIKSCIPNSCGFCMIKTYGSWPFGFFLLF